MSYTENSSEVTLLARLMVLEKQIEGLEKASTKATETISELHERIGNLKYQLQRESVSKETVLTIEKNLKTLEEKVASVKLEMSEITLFKRLGWLVLSFILMSILGFILNVTVFNKHIDRPPEDIVKKLDEISEKLSIEYKK
jgi:hypothetical protein